MTFFSNSVMCIAVALGLTAASGATAQQFFCQVEADASIVPQEFLITYSGGSATVMHSWFEAPLSHDVRVRGSSSRPRMSFIISNVSGFGAAEATLSFSLTHNRSSNGLTVRVNPMEYSNSFGGRGTCEQV